MRTALFILALILLLLAAVLDFGWLTDPDDVVHPLGIACVGLAAFVAGHLVND